VVFGSVLVRSGSKVGKSEQFLSGLNWIFFDDYFIIMGREAVRQGVFSGLLIFGYFVFVDDAGGLFQKQKRINI